MSWKCNNPRCPDGYVQFKDMLGRFHEYREVVYIIDKDENILVKEYDTEQIEVKCAVCRQTAIFTAEKEEIV